MKITVCDKCRTVKKKLVETTRYWSVKGHPNLRLDLCDTCGAEVKKDYPKITPEYVQYVYKLKGLGKIDLETAKIILQFK